MTSEINELIETIESLRAKNFPSLPVELVRRLIEIQYSYLEDDAEASRRIAAEVEQYLNEVGGNA